MTEMFWILVQPGGMGKSWKWSAEVGGHYWRTANDIRNSWESVLHNFVSMYTGGLSRA